MISNHSFILLSIIIASIITIIAILAAIYLITKNIFNFNKLTNLFNSSLDKFAEQNKSILLELFNQSNQLTIKELHHTQQKIINELAEHREKFNAHQLSAQKMILEGLQSSMTDIRQQLTLFIDNNAKTINQRLEALTQQTNQQLKNISGQVEQRLSEGFEKTTATFTDIVKRLALIDEAQKKITELSTNVVSLQSILNDKRSRGAFGEVQLAHLIQNVMPEKSYALQYTLSNNKRCDCILFLPEPTGNIVIDAKFPLETYQQLSSDLTISDQQKKTLNQQFKQDIKTHILAIADKYIIANETSDGAMMFIPAEAIFAEIHAHHPDLVAFANQKRVWLASPTTIMAILTTARAVIKDGDTRKQVHIIQEHLANLSKDFGRFQQRMDKLAKHIDQAQQDVADAHTSAKKITNRFHKIEQLEDIN